MRKGKGYQTKLGNEKKRRLFKAGTIIFLVIAAALVFNKILEEWTGFRKVLDTTTGAAAPIIIGFVIAFLLNPVLIFFDRLCHTILQDRVIKYKKKLFHVSRAISIIITIILFLGLLTGLIWMVVPQVIDSINLLISNMDNYYNNIMKAINTIYDKFKNLGESEEMVMNVVNTVYDRLQKWVNTDVVPNLDKIVLNISSGVVGGLKFIYNFLIGIVASIYVMANKEYLASRGKKIVYALFKLKNANIILDGLASVNKIFSQFINGKIVDSIIIGIITFILTTIVDMPYALLISVIIGVTNVIPFFGPIIGAIPCVFIVLIADPIKSIILLIMILCIQQFDGNILGPKILGDVTGLSSFWVLTAVIVGGGIFGFYGMLLGVPVFACIYMYINKTCTDKLEKKHMVSVSSEFERIKRIDEETGKPIYLTEEEEDIRFHKKTPEEKAAAKADREAKRHAKKLYQQIEKVMHAEKADDQLAATKHEAEKQSSDDDKDDQM